MRELFRGAIVVSSHSGRWRAEVVGEGGDGVQVVDQDTGGQLRLFRHHRGRIYALAWSPDDEHLAMGGLDGLASVAPARLDGPVITFTGHRDWVIAVSFSPDGGLVASGSFDRTVQVWAGPEGGTVRPPQTAPGADGRGAVAGAVPDLARALIQGTRIPGQRLAAYEGHAAGVYLVAFSPAARRLVSADLNGEVHVWGWDAVTGAAALNFKLAPEGVVEEFAWSPHGGYLAMRPACGLVELWDLTTGRFLTAFHSLAQVVWPEQTGTFTLRGASGPLQS